MLDSLAGGVFVGRQAEMGQFKAALEDALSGRGRMVTLVGEPGIWNKRTAQELATYAGLRGRQVLWGRCYEEQGVPPGSRPCGPTSEIRTPTSFAARWAQAQPTSLR